LNTHIEAWHIEHFKHDLGHLLSVFFRVKWCLSHQDWMLFW
jgi:hypothetical protein